MKKILLSAAIILVSIGISPIHVFAQGEAIEAVQSEQLEESHNEETHDETDHHNGETHEHHEEEHDAGHAMPEPWSVIPFILLLGMIATGPLFYAHFWHKNYPVIAVILGALVVIYYIAFLHDVHHPVHSAAEYFSFIALLAALFTASGGILIKVDKQGTPMVNVMLLIFGALIANIIGTTGASMLLIRPFIRLNKDRIKPYQIVFFIFMVSNVGGCLTPIGDPPLFLGFLKGVPFFWTVEMIWMKWFFGVGLLAIIFYWLDSRNKAGLDVVREYTGKIEVKGLKNTIWLGVTIGAVFLDPNVLDWVPAINYHGDKISFIREIIMLSTAFLSYKLADKECLKGNEFDFEPIREVAFLFIGIFATMMPALQLIGSFAKSAEGQKLITANSLYWFTGGLSGVLDNAPTYLNFLAAAMGKAQLNIGNKADVAQFAELSSQSGHELYQYLLAISVASVFFGAFTYIGNAPNFMVKSIAEQVGIKMPSFIGYIVRYAIPYLSIVLFLTWVVFFVLM
ncbi:MAG: citrate transporter [Chitinophagales bacterium]|nr:citrate transporter [Chitinophagales bacterium]